MKLLLCICVILIFVVSFGSAFWQGFPRDIWNKRPTLILISEGRQRRHVNGEKSIHEQIKEEVEWFMKTDIWCFCGENWIHGITKLEDYKNCAKKSNLDFNVEGLGVLDRGAKISEASQCTYECFLKNLNLTDSDGKINKTLATSFFMDKVFVEKKIQDTARKTLDYCLSNTDAYDEVINYLVLTISKNTCPCQIDGYHLMICLLFETLTYCPTGMKRNDVPQCKMVYDNLELIRWSSLYLKYH
uniref:Uncharacterized protein n=1 Tax=Clastoptera arizonana TaxID=38151 RepID=A0A1B6CL17_9HEMI